MRVKGFKKRCSLSSHNVSTNITLYHYINVTLYHYINVTLYHYINENTWGYVGTTVLWALCKIKLISDIAYV